jgi:hypothetical protein
VGGGGGGGGGKAAVGRKNAMEELKKTRSGGELRRGVVVSGESVL